MKYLFVGPSLSGRRFDKSGLVVLPPARQGDIAKAVLDGATAIGLVDGLFDTVAAVWHKEILYALASGVRMLGAASMGALRAAECREFGMEPIGAIAESYARGDRSDDSDVCLAHCPGEMDYAPLSEPLVDVEATIERLVLLGYLTSDEATSLIAAATELFFADRTVAAILDRAKLERQRAAVIAHAYEWCRISLKAEDALLLVAQLRQVGEKAERPICWSVRTPPAWRRVLDELAADGRSPSVDCERSLRPA